jgi:hypothetical protein
MPFMVIKYLPRCERRLIATKIGVIGYENQYDIPVVIVSCLNVSVNGSKKPYHRAVW